MKMETVSWPKTSWICKQSFFWSCGPKNSLKSNFVVVIWKPAVSVQNNFTAAENFWEEYNRNHLYQKRPKKAYNFQHKIYIFVPCEAKRTPWFLPKINKTNLNGRWVEWLIKLKYIKKSATRGMTLQSWNHRVYHRVYPLLCFNFLLRPSLIGQRPLKKSQNCKKKIQVKNWKTHTYLKISREKIIGSATTISTTILK